MPHKYSSGPDLIPRLQISVCHSPEVWETGGPVSRPVYKEAPAEGQSVRARQPTVPHHDLLIPILQPAPGEAEREGS